MARHSQEIISTPAGQFRLVCECKAASEWMALRSEAEDWGVWHLREVERAKAHLHTRLPSLRETYAYYRRMESDPGNRPADRDLWRALADGIEHRLGAEKQTDSMFEETG